ncbi:isopenicillin n-CoA synthetase [Emericellopsis atlantica]|uniref:Isopenicillin n-CoA synthetase n=1 Tax=Emericellopsis atlantica TaxID=2614577 RepID=A0A9P7ZDM9_9HYPO|nr:isopenicillin n-CoA synthetase [Emericellopsis atlantica]KAG9249801.1 isopenicillin n-CoA synthetase [Emericellopsis atlantica]
MDGPLVSQTLLAVAGITAGAAYADAKLHLSKDLNQLFRVRKAEHNLADAVRQNKASGFFLFADAAQRLQDAPCIWSREVDYTWRQAYERVCQYGNYFKGLQVKPSEHVAIYMINSPELLLVWMGLLSIGAAPALVNYNLASDALIHCVRLSDCRILMHSSDAGCAGRIHDAEQHLKDMGVVSLELAGSVANSIAETSTQTPQVSCFEDSKIHPLAIMYTSGTTGLPKAFPLTAARNYPSASLFPKTFGQTPGPGGDRSYYCIPLYHGTGGLAAMNDLMSGISIAIAPKFSLKGFWDDIIDSKATIFVYVGELIRYLLSAPVSPKDRKHNVRLVWGNGLSPDLWERFQERFGVPAIGEFYASTEGPLALVNHYRGGGFGLGAVGHQGWLLRRRSRDSYVPVETEAETGDIRRCPKTGLAKRLPYDQGGEVLVQLPSESAWAGYRQADDATAKKLVHNILKEGDVYFRTGDSLRRDDNGHWYFLDRLGDTYRWKGENVSTTEVSQVLNSDPDIAESNVYGVRIPGHDGKAGCAAIILKDSADRESIDWTRLTARLRSELPPYAVPIFLRLREAVGAMVTDNYKQKKEPLKLEGVDPDALGSRVPQGERDQILWLRPGSPRYTLFTRSDWAAISESRAKL